MELVGAPVPELRSLLSASFETWFRERQDAGDTGAGRSLSCGLSGGAPALIYLGALKQAQVDWKRITLFWVDERAVPTDHPESNYGVAERLLLQPLGAKAPTAIRMPADKMPLGQAALWYDDALATFLHNGPLDLALLGVGEDGHISALFPGHRALMQEDLRTVAIEDAPRAPARRLSLTLRFILQTRKVWVIAIGPRKRAALQAAIDKSSHATPLDLLMRQAKDVTVFTDQAVRRR